MSYADDRWTDSAPECSRCGRRIPRRHEGSRSRFSSECESCASGVKAEIPPEKVADRPVGSFYPPIRLTTEQLLDWKAKCQTYDSARQKAAAKRGEPVPLDPTPDIEYAGRKYGR